MKVTIKELRNALESHNPIASFSLAPDWVVLALYEKHCGLPQSRTGMPATRSLAEISRQYEKRASKAPAATAPAVNNDEAERMKLRLQSIQ